MPDWLAQHVYTIRQAGPATWLRLELRNIALRLRLTKNKNLVSRHIAKDREAEVKVNQEVVVTPNLNSEDRRA